MSHRILITGAGGPAAIAFARSMETSDTEVWMADMDPLAPGLHLVPRPRRLVVPPGRQDDFVEKLHQLCVEHRIDTLVPTVDAELEPLARTRERFEKSGTELILSQHGSLCQALDKWTFFNTCDRAGLPVPATALFDESFEEQTAASWGYPVVVKPRRGSGSRGVQIVEDAASLGCLERSSDWVVQEHLPGQEYSIDVLALKQGVADAAVPRLRLRVDSGVAVVSRTVRDRELERVGARTVEVLGLRFINNVQVKRDAAGRPRLLEVNPRTPGTLELTVASGIDMPRLALDALRGNEPRVPPLFREIACVRWLQQAVMSTDELEALCGPRAENIDEPAEEVQTTLPVTPEDTVKIRRAA